MGKTSPTQSLRTFFQSLVKYLYLDPLREAFIPLRDLPLEMRILGWGGYGVLVALIAVMIFAAFSGAELKMVMLPTVVGKQGIHAYVPLLVFIAALMALLLGWAYLLTAITASHPVVFSPFAALFCFQLTCLIPAGIQGVWGLVWLCAVLPLTLTVMLAYLFTYRKSLWRERPLLEFGIWLSLLVLSALCLWLGRGGFYEMTAGLNLIFSALFLLLIPLWLWMGLSLVEIGLDLAGRVVAVLRRWLPDRFFQILACFILVTPPLALGVEYLWERIAPVERTAIPLLMEGVVLHAILSLPLLLALAILVLRRHWDGYQAARLLALSLLLMIFALGLALALEGVDISNPLEWTIRRVSFLPSVLVFVTMLVYNVFGVGARFACGDSHLLPRQTRILLVFGLALLVTGLAIFVTNLRDGSGRPVGQWEDGFNNVFVLGLMLLGFPYLFWVVWKHGERLAGTRADFAAVEPRLASLALPVARKPQWTKAVFILGVLVGAMLLAWLIRV